MVITLKYRFFCQSQNPSVAHSYGVAVEKGVKQGGDRLDGETSGPL